LQSELSISLSAVFSIRPPLNSKFFDLFSSAKKTEGGGGKQPSAGGVGRRFNSVGSWRSPAQRLAKSTQQKDFTQSGQAQVLRRGGRRPFKPDFRILKPRLKTVAG
jgi:hypothetical protein